MVLPTGVAVFCNPTLTFIGGQNNQEVIKNKTNTMSLNCMQLDKDNERG